MQQLDAPEEVSCSWNAFAFRLVTFVKKCQGVEDGSPTLIRPSMLSASSLVESLLVPFPLFIFLYSTSKKCYTIFSVSLSIKNNTGWEDKTAFANLCFLLNCTPFFKTRKKSRLSAYIGPEKGRTHTKRKCKIKKTNKTKQNKKTTRVRKKLEKKHCKTTSCNITKLIWSHVFFFLTSLLEYNCSTMVC